MSKISELSDGGVIQGGDTLIAVRSGGNVKVTYGGTTTANIDGGTIDNTVIGGTTPAAGNFTTGSFTGNVSFGDNDKAIFGAGAGDLEIYHDGSNSYVEDTGDGALFLKTNGAGVFLYSGSEALATFNLNGASNLYYDNGLKLSTTTTGVDVTGTVTADGLTVDGNATIGQPSASDRTLSIGSAGATHFDVTTAGATGIVTLNATNDSTAGKINLQTADTDRLLISNNGDISFYESTGTTPKFFWDASAESLGIGTSSVSTSKLHVQGTTGTASAVRVESTAADSDAYYIADNDASVWTWGIDGGASDSWILSNAFGLGAPKMTVTTGGNVGIGTSSPTAPTDIRGANSAVHGRGQLFLSNTETAAINQGSQISLGGTYSGTNETFFASIAGRKENSLTDFAGYLQFATRAAGGSNVEHMRIDSSGNLLVGKTSPSSSIDGAELKNGNGVSAIIGTSDQSNAASGNVMILNRRTTDGTIVDFRKNGSTVGSIGVNSSNAYFASSEFGIKPTSVGLVSTNLSGVAQNGAEDLGGSSFRWRDLYLSGALKGNNITTTDAAITFINSTDALHFGSGTFRPFAADDGAVDLGTAGARFGQAYLANGVYLGGTTAANKLDDYEEGTWSPVYQSSTGSFTTMTMDATAFYTKVGNSCTVWALVRTDDVDATGATGVLQLGGLPFTASSSFSGTMAISLVSAFTANGYPASGYVQSGGTFINLRKRSTSNGADTGMVPSDLVDGTNANYNYMIFTMTYRTA